MFAEVTDFTRVDFSIYHPPHTLLILLLYHDSYIAFLIASVLVAVCAYACARRPWVSQMHFYFQIRNQEETFFVPKSRMHVNSKVGFLSKPLF